MNFIKRNLFYIICGLASAGGVALAFTGLSAMPEVEDELKKAKGVHDELGQLQSRPVNDDIIKAAQRRIDKVLSDSDRIFERAGELYNYEPLVPKAFPAGDKTPLFRFRTRYNEAMTALFDSLRSGTPATQQDVLLMEERIEKEIFQESQRGLDRDAVPDVVSGNEPVYTPAGVLTISGVKRRAAERAAIQKALTINCYATPLTRDRPSGRSAAPTGPTSSFQYHPELIDLDNQEPPFIEDCWDAQVQYWIQKDLVETINALNEEAGDDSAEAGGSRWVGVMPVKEIIAIRFSQGYIIENDDGFIGAQPGGFNEAFPCGTSNTVFTRSHSGPTYEVIQWTAKLIMDQRDVLKFVDRICKDRFHTLLRVGYTSVPANRWMRGKIYGSEPTVNVIFDFETIMLPDVFRPLMPSPICEQYEIDCPAPPTEGDEEEEE